MEAEARYTYVGIAVLALAAAAIAAVVWLKHAGADRNFSNFLIFFERQALDGLQIGGDVVLRGIKVGRVDDYALSGKKLNRVRVKIRVDRRTPVLESTVATISRNLVTGIAKIVLVNPESGGAPLTETLPDEDYPVIAEGSDDLQQIAGRVAELGDRAADVLDSLNKVLSPQNQANLGKALANIGTLTAAANERMGTLDRALTQFSGSAVAFGQAAERIAAAAGKAADGVADAGAKANANLEEALAEAKLTLVETRRTVNEAARTASAIQVEVATLAKRMDSTALSLDDQVTATLTEMRSGTEALNRTLDRLQDPRAALLGPSKAQLGPGEAR